MPSAGFVMWSAVQYKCRSGALAYTPPFFHFRSSDKSDVADEPAQRTELRPSCCTQTRRLSAMNSRYTRYGRLAVVAKFAQVQNLRHSSREKYPYFEDARKM